MPPPHLQPRAAGRHALSRSGHTNTRCKPRFLAWALLHNIHVRHFLFAQNARSPPPTDSRTLATQDESPTQHTVPFPQTLSENLNIAVKSTSTLSFLCLLSNSTTMFPDISPPTHLFTQPSENNQDRIEHERKISITKGRYGRR